MSCFKIEKKLLMGWLIDYRFKQLIISIYMHYMLFHTLHFTYLISSFFSTKFRSVHLIQFISLSMVHFMHFLQWEKITIIIFKLCILFISLSMCSSKEGSFAHFSLDGIFSFCQITLIFPHSILVIFLYSIWF